MDDAEKPNVINYHSNSNAKRELPEKNIEPIVVGKVVKRSKPLRRKFAETFAGDDAHSVGEFLFWDVIVPKTKDLISDLFKQGIDRILYGSSAPSRGAYSRVNYSKMYGSGCRDKNTRDLSTRARASHDTSEIILDSAQEANGILDAMSDLLEEYGVVLLSDLYAFAGVTGSFADNRFGWTDLSHANIRKVREGWLLDLPRVQAVE